MNREVWGGQVNERPGGGGGGGQGVGRAGVMRSGVGASLSGGVGWWGLGELVGGCGWEVDWA